MKKIYLISLTMIGLFLFGNSLKAQTYYNAANPDISAANSVSGVQNTGNYSVYFENSYYTNQSLRVSKKLTDAYIYPNPASGSFTLNLKDFSEPSSISISDVQGKILIKQLVKDSQSQIDINSLKTGIYFVNILNKDNIIVKILNVK